MTKTDTGSLDCQAAVALGQWLTLRGAAGEPNSYALWQETLTLWMRLLRLVVGLDQPLPRGSRATIVRLCDSAVNLTCALSWIDQERRLELTDALVHLQETIRAKK